MGKIIQIEIPEEIGILMESDIFIRECVKKIAEEEIVKYVLTILTMDKLAEESILTEEDIIELDKKIKNP